MSSSAKWENNSTYCTVLGRLNWLVRMELSAVLSGGDYQRGVEATTSLAVTQSVTQSLSDFDLVSAMPSPSFLHLSLSTELFRLSLGTSGYCGALLS